MRAECSFEINGTSVIITISQSDRLIDLLRGPLGLTGTKEGCGNGECGACTVIVDGRAVNACLFPAMEAHGKQITTIEGLAEPDKGLSSLQKAFVDNAGIQCGFCTPGMIMSAKALLDQNHNPDDNEIREALIGNLCRCTGYVQIVDSLKAAAQKMEK